MCGLAVLKLKLFTSPQERSALYWQNSAPCDYSTVTCIMAVSKVSSTLQTGVASHHDTTWINIQQHIIAWETRKDDSITAALSLINMKSEYCVIRWCTHLGMWYLMMFLQSRAKRMEYIHYHIRASCDIITDLHQQLYYSMCSSMNINSQIMKKIELICFDRNMGIPIF